MKKKLSFLLVLFILFWTAAAAAVPVHAENETEEKEKEKPKDNLVTTTHTAKINGKTIDYTATAGTMAIEGDGDMCDLFFIAYTKNDVKDVSSRPITFAFNGGPGSASVYTNYLCMGPNRLELDDKGHAEELPAKLVNNENSLLDLTDLVFIDAVGTGYSRAKESDEKFIGYKNDIRTIGDFIRTYVNRNGRWGSPKYIAGESYGTTRAVGLCEYLSDTYSMGLNGLMLISSVNDYGAVFEVPGNELTYAMFLPTYAADAWYQGRTAQEYQDMELEPFLEEVRRFVEEEYNPALFQGRALTDARKKDIAEKIAGYTGLSREFVLKNNLRIHLEDFCQELLRDDNLVVGRLDGRFTGPMTEGSIYNGTSDPSVFDLDKPLAAAVSQYITTDLQFQTDTPYTTLNLDVNQRWSFDNDNGFLSQEDIIRDCMNSNGFLKVWVLCGYYDGATPFYNAEYVYNHVFLEDAAADRLQFTYYPAGHMFYLDTDSFNQFRKDAEDWYQTAPQKKQESSSDPAEQDEDSGQKEKKEKAEPEETPDSERIPAPAETAAPEETEAPQKSEAPAITARPRETETPSAVRPG